MSWTVNQHGLEVRAIGYEARGMFRVPIVEPEMSVEVWMILHGAYGNGWNVGITRPTERELTALEEYGWQYDGAFASKRG